MRGPYAGRDSNRPLSTSSKGPDETASLVQKGEEDFQAGILARLVKFAVFHPILPVASSATHLR